MVIVAAMVPGTTRNEEAPTPQKIAIGEALSRFTQTWSPKVVGDVNECQVKLVKLEGEFNMHHHDDEDELFLLVDGTMTMRFTTHSVDLVAGELIIVPRGVDHQPVATPTCSVLLFEPGTTLNTGNAVTEHTVHDLERLD